MILAWSAKSSARVMQNNSVSEYTRILVSFAFDREIAAFRPRPTPKEAGCIACDRNEEEECLHLRPLRRRKAKGGRKKDVMWSEIFLKETRVDSIRMIVMHWRVPFGPGSMRYAHRTRCAVSALR